MKSLDVFKALSDENRIRILHLLLKGEFCVCDIEAILKMSQTNASRHLAKLKAAGLVEMRKEYQWAYYRINEVFMKNNQALFAYLRNILETDDTCMQDNTVFDNYKERGEKCRTIKKAKK